MAFRSKGVASWRAWMIDQLHARVKAVEIRGARAEGLVVPVLVTRDAAVFATARADPAKADGKVRAVDSGIVLAALVGLEETATRDRRDVLVGTTIGLAAEVDFGTGLMRVACLAQHTNARSGVTGRIAFVTHAGRATTKRDRVPTHWGLDRSHRRRDVQRQERGAHAPR